MTVNFISLKTDYKTNQMKTRKYLFLFVAFLLIMASCKEEGRHDANSNDKTPPGKVKDITYKPLYGGARFFYTIPNDEDLLNVEAVYTNAQNQSFTFSASYYTDSLDVYGFAETIEYTVQLYAVDRVGNRSEAAEINVVPLKAAYTRVAESMVIKPGFSSFILDWENELKQNINIYVDFSYTQNGTPYEFSQVFSSNLETDRRFIEDLYLTPQDPVNVRVRVEDIYGNITAPVDYGQISLLEDIKIPKADWKLPNPNDSIADVPMCFGNGFEGRLSYVIDDLIDRGDNLNFMHTNSRGRTGHAANGNMPWNFIIDLGDYYELSRIITHQRHSGGLANISQGQYYKYENVGIYRIYILDESTDTWEQITEHKIPVPIGLSEIEIVKLGEAGDMAYMYPNDPQYTKPARWFRYEAYKCFDGNYTMDNALCLSEITLYGRKSTKQ